MAKTKESRTSPRLLSNNVSVTTSQRKIPISIPSAERTVFFLLEKSGLPGMALHFVGVRTISQLHNDYFEDPTPTDCITLCYDDPIFLGEVYVCPQVAKEYIDQNGGSINDEVTLYVVHGFLHLLGFDDQNEKDQKKMRLEEKKWMRLLAKNKLGITINPT